MRLQVGSPGGPDDGSCPARLLINDPDMHVAVGDEDLVIEALAADPSTLESLANKPVPAVEV